MRDDIAFDAEGCTLRGWLYRPERGRAPAVVIAHGWGAVKEMYLDVFAATLPILAAGLDAPSIAVDETSTPVGNDGAAWFGAMSPARRAAWRNELTLRSYELYAEYEPGSYVTRIAPTPLRVVTADADTLTPTDEILAAYGEAREPKSLVLLRGGHYDLYGVRRAAAAAAARDWFVAQLVDTRA